jgi:hypothetical protein
MKSDADVNRMIRDALHAEDLEGFAELEEPSLPDAVTEIFRGRMRVYGGMVLAMIIIFFVVAVLCAVQFFGTDDVPQMLRWGAGFFLSVMAVMGGKNWWWTQVERIAMTREIKRVELLVAQLAAELRE